MLTTTDYLGLWGHFYAIPYYGRQGMPNYDSYIQREHFLQDYLDIFRGYNSRGNINIRPIASINPIYDHPFFDANGNQLQQLNGIDLNDAYGKKIKYILVAEACPNLGLNYFYDINQIATNGQTYLNACFQANYQGNVAAFPWSTFANNQDKINVLLDLTRRGILLLDLFPFALKYETNPRINLNNNSVTKSFWNDNTNFYNLQSRVTDLCPLLANDWDLTLIAPSVISEHIINPANNINCLGIQCNNGIHPITFRNVVNPALPNPGVTTWVKIAIGGAYYPTANAITNSFI